MFIRAKKIKKHLYAYAVKNKWTKKGSRQKIVGYLGRVHKFEPVKDINFELFLKKDMDQYFEKTKPKKIIKDYIGFELHKHGFEKASSEKASWIKGDFQVDLNKLSIKKGASDTVIHMNNDFFCNLTLKKLINFRSKSDQEECGRELAKAFITAGISVQSEVFVEVFRKIFREGDVSYV